MIGCGRRHSSVWDHIRRDQEFLLRPIGSGVQIPDPGQTDSALSGVIGGFIGVLADVDTRFLATPLILEAWFAQRQ